MADANLKARPNISQRFMACEAAVRECGYTKKLGPYTLPLPVPRIRLTGRWLEQAGFKPHSRVCVQVEEGRLIITPA